MPSSWGARSCRADALGPAELKLLLLALLAGYLCIAALVWLTQDSLIFHPRPAPAEVQAPPGWRLETVSIATADGNTLAGVLVAPPQQSPALVIYFGGNAEEVTAAAASVRDTYGERAVLLVNYRGYGGSSGRPGETALLADALLLHDWAARHPGIDASRIAVHGRSLGSGVAVPLAAARPVRCVILTSPFDSALEVARAVYFFLPVSLLMRHPFDSVRVAPRVKAPLLVITGEADNIIAPHHSERLARAWAGPVERLALPGFGHNDLQMHPRYNAALREFLDRTLGAKN
jgi:fermentation-respiration switch protein FrsA (DUF1100 family)